MPVEFNCPSCGKRLSVGDELAGRRVLCPQCRAECDVPGPIGPAAGGSPASPPAWSSPPSTPAGQFTVPAHVNPYSSPSAATFSPTTALRPGELVPTTVYFSAVLNRTWEIFTAQLGPCVLVGLVNLGVAILLQGISFVGQLAAGAAGEPIVLALFQLADYVFGLVVQTWLNAGVLNFSLRMVRTRDATVNDMFTIGPYFLRCLVVNFLVTLATVLLLLIAALPAGVVLFLQGGPDNFQNNPGPTIGAGLAALLVIMPLLVFVAMRVLLAVPFILDRNLDAIAALQHSFRFMSGNVLTAFGLFLVVGLLAIVVAICTCFFGIFLFFVPYMGLMTAVIYFMATGQLPAVGGVLPQDKPAP